MLNKGAGQKWYHWDFSDAEGVDLLPGHGAKILHDLWPINQNIKQKQHYKKFSKRL